MRLSFSYLVGIPTYILVGNDIVRVVYLDSHILQFTRPNAGILGARVQTKIESGGNDARDDGQEAPAEQPHIRAQQGRPQGPEYFIRAGRCNP